MNRSVSVSISDILFAENWNLDRTVAFMEEWVKTSIMVKIH